MELDTRAAMSLISQSTYDKLFSNVKLRPSDIILRTYTSQAIIVLGQLDADVIYEDQKRKLSLLVIKGSGPSLIGRNWMLLLHLNWSSIKLTRTSNNQMELDLLISKYPSVFDDELGSMKTFSAKLDFKPGSKPKFFRSRPVPFALRENIEQELQRLEDASIITRLAIVVGQHQLLLFKKKMAN